jgi:hypothetical protein
MFRVLRLGRPLSYRIGLRRVAGAPRGAPNQAGVWPWLLALLGIGAFVAGTAAFIIGALLLGPILVWLSWNVLDLAHAVGAQELGFGGLLLVAIFLAVGLAGRVLIVALIFIVDPDWLHHSARLHWPEPTLRNFVAICLLLLVASVSSQPMRDERRRGHGRWQRA